MARTQAADYELRREAIMEKSAQLFADVGFNGVSVGELAAACGISKALLYHYYDSKEAVLYAVMASHVELLGEDLAAVMAEEGTSLIRLRDLVRRFLRHYAGAANSQKVLLNELGSLPEDKRTLLIAKQRRLIEAVQALLTDIHPVLAGDPVRAKVETMLLFGMINWTHTWFDPSGPLSPDEVAAMVLERIEHPLRLPQKG